MYSRNFELWDCGGWGGVWGVGIGVKGYVGGGVKLGDEG